MPTSSWKRELAVNKIRAAECFPVMRFDVGWMVVLGSVYIGPSPSEREKEERKDRGE